MLVCLFGFYCWYFCTFVRIVVLPYFSLSTCKRLYLFCRKITVSKNWPEPTKTTTKKRLAWAIDRTTENHVPEIKTDLDCLFFICWLICLFVLFVSERSSAESLRCTHYLWKRYDVQSFPDTCSYCCTYTCGVIFHSGCIAYYDVENNYNNKNDIFMCSVVAWELLGLGTINPETVNCNPTFGFSSRVFSRLNTTSVMTTIVPLIEI